MTPMDARREEFEKIVKKARDIQRLLMTPAGIMAAATVAVEIEDQARYSISVIDEMKEATR